MVNFKGGVVQMNQNVRGEKMEVRGGVRDDVEKKIGKVEGYFEREVDA